MKNNPEKTIIITDSGFGGLSVLAEIYESLKHDEIFFPLNLFFIEALPKNCKGYPWKGYSLMPDKQTKIKVFNNFLKGTDRHFTPDLIAIACNTLSAIVQETEFYKINSGKILNIIDIGLEKFNHLQIDRNSYLLILATETTISSDLHRQGIIRNKFFENGSIIPVPFPAHANYPLLIETEPHSKKTYDVTEETLLNAVQKIQSEPSVIYVYLGCTHFGFIQEQYQNVLSNAGFKKTEFINPNADMAQTVTDFIRKLNYQAEKNMPYPIKTKIYSQFTLTSEQISSGNALIHTISPTIAQALKNYTMKDDIIVPWEE